jgi:hypothetical protein
MITRILLLQRRLAALDESICRMGPTYDRWRPVLQPIAPLALLFLCVVGCAEPSGTKPGNGHMDREDTSSVPTKLASAHRLLGPNDIKAFRPGRSKADILNDVQWRGNFEEATAYKGKSISAISYALASESPENEGPDVLWAIFINDNFEKFVQWPKGETEVIDYKGTPWSRPKPSKVGDFGRLIRAADSPPVNIPDIEQKAKATPSTPSQVDLGLTIAWLLLRPAGGSATEVASEDDYKKNAKLRDQFNASRLKIGMTESEVESILKAKPIESAEVGANSVEIYGSTQSFNIVSSLHFSNILVVFREGKLIGIYSGEATPGGERGLQQMRDWFVGLPVWAYKR